MDGLVFRFLFLYLEDGTVNYTADCSVNWKLENPKSESREREF